MRRSALHNHLQLHWLSLLRFHTQMPLNSPMNPPKNLNTVLSIPTPFGG